MANDNKIKSDAALLSRLSGKLPYADALTTVRVPVEVIESIRSDKFEPLTTKNGKSEYTHRAVLLIEHDLFPPEMLHLQNLLILDWLMEKMLGPNGITEETITMLTRARRLPDGNLDCAFIMCSISQRTMGKYYQHGDRPEFKHEPTAEKPEGSQQFFIDPLPINALTPPIWVQDKYVTAIANETAKATQIRLDKKVAVEEMRRAVRANRKAVSKEELEMVNKVESLRDIVADHNTNVNKLKAIQEAATVAADKKQAASDVVKATEELDAANAELTKAQEELKLIREA